MIAVIAIEPVFSTGEDLKTSTARRNSILLYESLVSQYNLVALTRADLETSRWWLSKERMPKWSSIHGWDEGNFFTYSDWKVHKVGDLLSAAFEVAWYLDGPDPALLEVLTLGVPVMRIETPVSGPGFKDLSQPPRAWSDVAGTVLSGGGDDGSW